MLGKNRGFDLNVISKQMDTTKKLLDYKMVIIWRTDKIGPWQSPAEHHKTVCYSFVSCVDWSNVYQAFAQGNNILMHKGLQIIEK